MHGRLLLLILPLLRAHPLAALFCCETQGTKNNAAKKVKQTHVVFPLVLVVSKNMEQYADLHGRCMHRTSLVISWSPGQ